MTNGDSGGQAINEVLERVAAADRWTCSISRCSADAVRGHRRRLKSGR